MKRKRGLKAVLASVLVTLALAVPAIVFSAGTSVKGEIHFQGAELRAVMVDGEVTVQAIFDVSINHVANIDAASFYLNYNAAYLSPSDMDTNRVLKVGSTTEFFEYNHDLYYIEDSLGARTEVNPFGTPRGSVSTAPSQLWLSLELEQAQTGIIASSGGASGTALAGGGTVGGEVGLLTEVGYDSTTLYVLNLQQDPDDPDNNGPVTLGQISFQVNKDHMAEMIHYFNGLNKTRDYNYASGSRVSPWVTTESLGGTTPEDTFLLDIDQSKNDAWTIGYAEFKAVEGTGTDAYLKDHTNPLYPATGENQSLLLEVADSYQFNFAGKTVVDVQATAPEVTVNAYQNFTEGEKEDLPLTMGRYSPTVTVTYADGSKENVPFPWGQNDYAVKQETDAGGTATVTDTNYDPTHGVYYFTQKYTHTDGTVFPDPVTAKLTVTPITVIDVVAEDMTRDYELTNVVNEVPDVNSLRLPEEARIVTDIVPSGVSLTTPIKGWKPVQPAAADPDSTPGSGDEKVVSSWPDPAANMHALKADEYVLPATPPEDEGYPHWPETSDQSGGLIATNPEYFLGSYTFETSQSDHATQEHILSADIQKRYPWLTIPYKSGSTTDRVEEWDVGQAKRNILNKTEFEKVDPSNYEVTYVSTVTETSGNGQFTPDSHRSNGVGQPTLRLSVTKHDVAGSTAKYGSMSPDSVFRVWLPNGQELGTGQVSGGVTVENWFGDATNTSDPDTHVNGYYYGEKQTGGADFSGDGVYFDLVTNPDQPEVNGHGDQRETLRRYINLGGWYQVAICENPGDAAPVWTAPIPVYVPPRRNEYVENKIYNFLGENAALCNWPGGVGNTLYLPHGDYAVVGPLDTSAGSYTAGVGLPLYEVGGAATDGSQNPSVVFESGNRFRVLDGVTRYRESYGVKTIYDGQTGAQPGEIFNVRVKDGATDLWNDLYDRPDGTVDPLVGTSSVYKYGPAPLYEGIITSGVAEGYAVAGFGRVFQPDLTASSTASAYTATLRREDGMNEKPAESVRVKLLSWDVDGITRVGSDFDNDNVTLVTYDAKQVGYTVRQDFTLTIKNVGTTDIYGLDIDTVTDGYNLNDDGVGGGPKGGHFEMLVPPASFLPVGSTTTFTLTYVYDLPVNKDPNALSYRDTLYITANGHNNPGKGHQHDTGLTTDDYLLDFDAEFVVSDSPLHKVTVIYRPTEGTMGTANLIVGKQATGGGATTMVYTPTTRTYPKDGKVYVAVNKIDEYEIKSMTATIDGVTVNLLLTNSYQPDGTPVVSSFTGTSGTDPMKPVFEFTMPDHDVTVYVDFYEPFHSKLRLENLIDFSAPDNTTDNDLKTSLTSPDPSAQHTYPLWRKTFTDAERTAAAAWNTATTEDEDYYLMTQGRAMPHSTQWPTVTDADDEGQKFVSGENQYLVVIDADADLSQLEAKIRRVVYHEDYQGVNAANYPNGYNYEIELSVQMDVYPYNVEKTDTGGGYNWNTAGYQPEHVYLTDTTATNALGYDGTKMAFTGSPYMSTSTGGSTIVSSTAQTYPPADYRTGTSTSDSSTHVSVQFPSPKKGESSYAVITLSAYNPEIGATDSRSYYVEIHRKTDEPDVVLHYGNSPYGMIMNEDRFNTDAKQNAAKTAFKNAGYTFEGLKKEYVPDAVWNHSDMQHVIYNREAWVVNRGVFEPESLTGFTPSLNSDNTQKFSDAPTNTKPIYEPVKSVYSEADDLDLNDYAYFAILGEDLREPGILSAKDSSGRPVDLNAITAVAVDVDWDNKTNTKGLTLLDTTQTKQVARFQGNTTDFPILDLGIQGSTLTFAGEHNSTSSPLTLTAKNWPVSSKEVTTTPAGGGDPVTTTEYTLIEDIRPGRYAIVYRYTDFDGTSTLWVKRPFVILRGVGDVNTDGVRDNVKTPASGSTKSQTDEYHLEDRVGNDPLGYEAGLAPTATEPYGAGYPFANIFKFRVCDVNNDRNVNHIDANQVDKNVRSSDSGWLRFYHPTDYGLPSS